MGLVLAAGAEVSMGMEWGVIALAIGGMLVVLWAAAYFQGRNSARAAQAQQALTKQQEVDDAVAASRLDHGHFELDVDGRVRRQPGPPAGVPGQHRPNP